MAEIDVFYIKGIDREGRLVELAKFFDAGHANAHLSKFTRPTSPWTEVGIVIVKERLEDQHPAHRR